MRQLAETAYLFHQSGAAGRSRTRIGFTRTSSGNRGAHIVIGASVIDIDTSGTKAFRYSGYRKPTKFLLHRRRAVAGIAVSCSYLNKKITRFSVREGIITYSSSERRGQRGTTVTGREGGVSVARQKIVKFQSRRINSNLISGPVRDEVTQAMITQSQERTVDGMPHTPTMPRHSYKTTALLLHPHFRHKTLRTPAAVGDSAVQSPQASTDTPRIWPSKCQTYSRLANSKEKKPHGSKRGRGSGWMFVK